MNKSTIYKIIATALTVIVSLTLLGLGIYFLVETSDKCANKKDCTIIINSTDCIFKYGVTTCTCDKDEIIIDENFVITDKNNITFTDTCYTDRYKAIQCPRLSAECRKISGMSAGGGVCIILGVIAVFLSVVFIPYVWKNW